MSLDATRWAWSLQIKRPLHKLVLLSLADRADSDDCVWPCYDRLAVDTGCDKKTVWGALKQLKADGIIVDTGARKGVRGNIVVYKLAGVDRREVKQINNSKNGMIPKTEIFPKTDSNDSENGIPNDSENGMQNQSLEPTKEPCNVQQAEQPIPISVLAKQILSFLNEKTSKRYPETKANLDLIAARLKEGFSVSQCRAVIAKKYREWHSDEKLAVYLRPKTIFNRTNFSNYVGELGARS